ncbi:hypothetical protein [Micromonospora echinofusca]|uniref:Uncharacterized protein n=1 Tax=Micromonospora echinofusca TaxID=47858 RepID=A0ABS3VVQ3_MICEH|nr:hypothetical protein [Micromonospora echinofusca]MBO4208614.1 hypothetical protein [Micromonospora echinofusca]
MIEARTLAEAYLYLELTLPVGDDAVDYDRHTTLDRRDDEHYLLRFDGPYGDRHWNIEVTVPLASHRAADGPTLCYGSGRSRLLDAGQWYAIEDGYAGMARTGLTRLAHSGPDEATYLAVVAAWDAARAAADEIAKFLPPDAEEVPAEAFWTEHGRSVRAARPEAFRRDRLDTARNGYRRRLDEAQSRIAGTGAQRPGTPGPTPAGGPTDPVPVRVRSLAEAHVHLDLRPCGCGSAGFPRDRMTVLVDDPDRLLVRYAGPCDGCGAPRDVVFELPPAADRSDGPAYLFSGPADGPSEALDAADWLGVAEGYGALADALLAAVEADVSGDAEGRWRDPQERAAMVRLLAGAAAAVEEVLKFLPGQAPALPAAAFWTGPGRERYARQRDLFDRDRLTRWCAHRWRVLDEFTARYGR